jgi:heme-degrading monooxygenase HmoA
MVIVILHHWVMPDKMAQARVRIDENGDAMAAAPGFRFRYRIENPDEPLKISTLTAWADDASHHNFRNAKMARDAANGIVAPYDRVEREVFQVKHAHSGFPEPSRNPLLPTGAP